MSCAAFVILVGLATAPPHGSAGAAVLRGQTAWAWNRHGGHGADGRRHDSAVTITLVPGGRATVQDSGTSRETVLHRPPGGFKEEKTTWSTRWQGTWTRTGNRLQLGLRRGHRHCDRTETWRGSAPRRLACTVAPARLTLECTASDVPVEGQPGGPAVREPVWRCSPVGSTTDLGGTAVPWVLGRDRCLRSTGGVPFSGRSRYAPCPP